jgi:integrase
MPTPSISGHVRLREGKRGAVWYAKWRDASGQHEKRLGTHWTGKGRPSPGFLREKEAQAALQAILTDARRGAAHQTRTGITFADVAEQWFARGRLERDWSRATEATYRSALNKHLLAAFGELRIETISTARIERWRNEQVSRHGMQRRQANMLLAILHGIFKRAQRHHDLQRNPTEDVPKLRESYDAARFDFFSPDEIRRLAEHAAHEQDAIAYLVAAFTGIRRGELVGLLWEDVDFANHSIRVWEQIDRRGGRQHTKSRKSRTVPMIQQAAEALQRLKDRGHHTAPKDPVFLGEHGETMDGSALRRRYLKDREAADLRELRFHDLRHTFGSLAINFASIVQVQAWMGHAKITTTMRYLHHKSRAEDARLLSAAFASEARRAA